MQRKRWTEEQLDIARKVYMGNKRSKAKPAIQGRKQTGVIKGRPTGNDINKHFKTKRIEDQKPEGKAPKKVSINAGTTLKEEKEKATPCGNEKTKVSQDAYGQGKVPAEELKPDKPLSQNKAEKATYKINECETAVSSACGEGNAMQAKSRTKVTKDKPVRVKPVRVKNLEAPKPNEDPTPDRNKNMENSSNPEQVKQESTEPDVDVTDVESKSESDSESSNESEMDLDASSGSWTRDRTSSLLSLIKRTDENRPDTAWSMVSSTASWMEGPLSVASDEHMLGRSMNGSIGGTTIIGTDSDSSGEDGDSPEQNTVYNLQGKLIMP